MVSNGNPRRGEYGPTHETHFEDKGAILKEGEVSLLLHSGQDADLLGRKFRL
jgi:hypothetical protein